MASHLKTIWSTWSVTVGSSHTKTSRFIIVLFQERNTNYLFSIHLTLFTISLLNHETAVHRFPYAPCTCPTKSIPSKHWSQYSFQPNWNSLFGPLITRTSSSAKRSPSIAPPNRRICNRLWSGSIHRKVKESLLHSVACDWMFYSKRGYHLRIHLRINRCYGHQWMLDVVHSDVSYGFWREHRRELGRKARNMSRVTQGICALLE